MTGRSIRLWILLGLLLGGFGCASGRLLQAELRVGVAPDDPPIVFEHEGEIVGIEADLAHAVAARIGRRVEFKRIPQPDLLTALEAGEVDVVMSGLAITEARQQRVLFTAPYMEVGQLTLIRASDIGRFGRIQSLRRSGARVGYERGTGGEQYVAEQLTRSMAFAFDDIEEGIRSLRAGRIDFLIHDAPNIWRLAGDPAHRDLVGLYRPLTQEQIAWAVRKDDRQLHALLDATLSHWRREGLIEPILNRWIPVRIRVP